MNRQLIIYERKLNTTALILFLMMFTQFALYFHLYTSLLKFEKNIKSLTRLKRDSSDSDNIVTENRGVEFYNPKQKNEIEDDKGNQTNPWVYLTSFSRISTNEMEKFCLATIDYCKISAPGIPGPPGSPGKQGDKGNRGERGERGPTGTMGIKGPPGIIGEPGPRGPKGDAGPRGVAGVDGRDGIPGEPGLDGLPGRNGKDGIPGITGAPGRDGIPGKPGTNGTDGIPGLSGPRGPLGPVGLKGITGPRGKPGRPGVNGIPGLPGITTYEVKINGTKSSELLIPPSIIGKNTAYSAEPIVINEGDNVRLTCSATGYPRPNVEWTRPANVISNGIWKENVIIGNIYNITHVQRYHMGPYTCLASNGIPPPDNHTYFLEVHFLPNIYVQNPQIAARNHSTAQLQCEVETYPYGLKYWEKDDGRPIENSAKYSIGTIDLSKYKSLMQLNISSINSDDFADYYCISKNELGPARGTITVYELKPGMKQPKPIDRDGIYRKRPVDRSELDDLCPPSLSCPECTFFNEFKCKQFITSLHDLIGPRDRPEVQTLLSEKPFPGLPNKVLDCQVYAVGKPVYHTAINVTIGSWMRDAQPRTDLESEKYWATREEESNNLLLEYINKTVYRADMPTKKYKLYYPFKGNAHVIYNGSFFYHHKGKPEIVKYDLQTGKMKTLIVPNAKISNSTLLYILEYNYMDFCVDDNGLWVIYGLPNINNTAVIKIDSYTLEIQYGWNITLKYNKAGEMFIVCGVLYVVDSTTEIRTHIRFAFDLYRNKLLDDINIEFTNPFRRTTMIGYNHRNKELYTWDKGNQLTYPIRAHDSSSYNYTRDEKSEIDGTNNYNRYET